VTSAAGSLSIVDRTWIRNARLRRVFTCSTREITRKFVELRALTHRFEFDMRSQATLPQDLKRAPSLRNFDQFRA
jgi:hypothetical protein